MDIGDIVVFTDEISHLTYPKFYPEVGTVGEIVSCSRSFDFRVKWPDGSTSGTDVWNVYIRQISLLSECKDYQELDIEFDSDLSVLL